jgi:hypothetical protein
MMLAWLLFFKMKLPYRIGKVHDHFRVPRGTFSNVEELALQWSHMIEIAKLYPTHLHSRCSLRWRCIVVVGTVILWISRM